MCMVFWGGFAFTCHVILTTNQKQPIDKIVWKRSAIIVYYFDTLFGNFQSARFVSYEAFYSSL